MTDTFETTLARIISQKSIFESLDERAVEIGVVLPLLRQVGWNTEDVLEVYPQRKLSNGKVDYDLQICGESRILIEVKSWGPNLDDGNEKQLERYCRSAKPELAVLTSGQMWRLYLPPTQRVGLKRKQFVDIDVTEQPTETKQIFRRFLARDKMVDFKPTVSAAKKLLKEIQGQEKLKEALTDALNELANDKDKLAQVLQKLVERKGIQQSLENVKHVLEEPAFRGIVNEVGTGTKSQKKPASFSILASPNGQKMMSHTVGKPKGWYNFLSELCELMHERHRESFRENMLSMADRFAESKGPKFSEPIGEVGIYARKLLTSGQIRTACYEIVTKFGYPEDSLVILDSDGVKL